MIISRGDPMVFVTRPIRATLLALSVIVLVIVLLPSVRKKREEVFVEEE
jgi:TctA family transporter